MSPIEILFNQCRKRDAKAQKGLYTTFSKKMFVHCLRYVKQKEDAEDVLVQGFIKVLDKISSIEYQGDKAFEGWMRKIFINESLMFLRRRKDVLFLDHSEVPEVESFDDNFSNLCATDIFALIAALPTGLRTVFNLYVIDGYTHNEIANMLHIAEGTSKSNLSKARAILQQTIKKSEQTKLCRI